MRGKMGVKVAFILSLINSVFLFRSLLHLSPRLERRRLPCYNLSEKLRMASTNAAYLPGLLVYFF